MTADPTIKQPVPTGVALTPLDASFRRDPHAALDELREREPVHHDAVLNRWILTRFEDMEPVLRDRSMSVDPHNAAEGTFERMFMFGDAERQQSMLFSDPPYHTRLRGLVSKAFTPRAVESMAPRIRAIADELLDAVADTATFDLIGAYAAPLPTIVIAEMLGVDPADQDDFKRWSDDSLLAFNPMLDETGRARVDAARGGMDGYLRRAIAERRASPRADMVTALIEAEEGGERLNDTEIVSMCSLLLAAGNVTTTDLIGNGVLALLQHPDQMQLLRDDPALMKNAIEEMLRYDGPVTQTGRTPLNDANVAGCPIATGQSITPFLAAAGHDPAVNEDPHQFDITRAEPRHLAFGGGIHYCLGAPLARLEGQIAVRALLERFPKMRLTDGELEWKTVPSFRGLSRLDVATE